ncbi:S1C family serine protease [Exiguobacterium flavidum]|uniref:S1C family serine protease n=1 Tax=Exiguobacterium flavidum TaxID=2184695 RepID=UPI001E5605EB|nr:trypsin-like peptidase domain-containing protein [Exiguobacterium flavidum]
MKKQILPGITGGILGSVLTGMLAFPFLASDLSPVADTPLLNGMPKQVSSTSNDPLTNTVATAQKSVVTVTSFSNNGTFNTSDEASGSGSGVIYKKSSGKAYIVSNHHVVDGADKLEITTNDGTKLEAKLLGSDATYDLAVLEVDGSAVKDVIKIGESSELKQGQTVFAIGNPLGEFQNSVTRGIISSVDRTVPVDTNEDGQNDFNTEVLQTDAAINPGNSGGALIDAKGRLIGINSMKIAETGVEGVGFSIPIDEAFPIIKQLEENGKVAHPTLGVSLQDVSAFPSGYLEEQINLPNSQTTGVVILAVEPDSPAADAGLQSGDVIISIDGKKVESFADVKTALVKSDGTVDVEFLRNGKARTVTATVSSTNQL